jgi:hypothetical protein
VLKSTRLRIFRCITCTGIIPGKSRGIVLITKEIMCRDHGILEIRVRRIGTRCRSWACRGCLRYSRDVGGDEESVGREEEDQRGWEKVEVHVVEGGDQLLKNALAEAEADFSKMINLPVCSSSTVSRTKINSRKMGSLKYKARRAKEIGP